MQPLHIIRDFSNCLRQLLLSAKRYRQFKPKQIKSMGLDMRPMGKPKPGFEKRFIIIFEMLTKKHNSSTFIF